MNIVHFEWGILSIGFIVLQQSSREELKLLVSKFLLIPLTTTILNCVSEWLVIKLIGNEFQSTLLFLKESGGWEKMRLRVQGQVVPPFFLRNAKGIN